MRRGGRRTGRLCSAGRCSSPPRQPTPTTCGLTRPAATDSAPGGASSLFLPANHIDVPLDFASVAQAGSMLGSGALIVVADGTDMLDVAANVTRFFRNESCGKCVPCRLGTEAAVKHVDDYRANRVATLNLPMLQQLAETLQQTSICGLGQVAMAPLQSALKYWPVEVSSDGEG